MDWDVLQDIFRTFRHCRGIQETRAMVLALPHTARVPWAIHLTSLHFIFLICNLSRINLPTSQGCWERLLHACEVVRYHEDGNWREELL